jgi:hypothetical protein
VPHDTRDALVDFVRSWSDKTDIPVCRFLPWIGITSSKFHDWRERYGKVNEHNAWVPRDHWLTDVEKTKIQDFARSHPLVKTSPYYPQSNGKIERWHKTLKGECIRVQVPLELDDARRLVKDYVGHYNDVRLHSALGYVTPKDKLEGRGQEIFAQRDRKLAEARERRKQSRQQQSDKNARSDAPMSPPPQPAIDFAAIRAGGDISSHDTYPHPRLQYNFQGRMNGQRTQNL